MSEVERNRVKEHQAGRDGCRACGEPAGKKHAVGCDADVAQIGREPVLNLVCICGHSLANHHWDEAGCQFFACDCTEFRHYLETEPMSDGDDRPGLLAGLKNLESRLREAHERGESPGPGSGLPHYADMAVVVGQAARYVRRLQEHDVPAEVEDGDDIDTMAFVLAVCSAHAVLASDQHSDSEARQKARAILKDPSCASDRCSDLRQKVAAVAFELSLRELPPWLRKLRDELVEAVGERVVERQKYAGFSWEESP